jgi:purine catabolism regulator
MSLRVIDLLGNPALRTRLLAGADGVERTIHWAHSCEDVNPWEWLGQGELVMMSGRSFPADPGGQVAFVRNMAAARLAGLALAQDMGAPALAPAALDQADALGFPIMETAYEVPWVLIARAVAEATTRTGQLTKIMRVYDCYRLASQENVSDIEALRRLEREISARLVVLDLPTSRPIIGAGHRVPGVVVERLRGLATEDHLPGITRVPDDETMHIIIPLGREREVLVASVTGDALDLVLLQHVGAILSVLAERSRADVTMRINSGMSFLTLLLQGRLDGEHAKERLDELGVAPGPWQVLALRGATRLDAVSVLRSLSEDRPALVVPGPSHLTLLVLADDCEAVAKAAVMLVEGGRVGISDVVRSIAHLPDAVREARWALETAQGANQIVYYGIDRPLFLPRTLTEARDVVGRVLGDLIAYDEQHGTHLVASLQTYFDSKRSWQVASRELQVHKQTLVYRMRRIEEITGRDLDDLNDVTELHLALRSLNLLVES